jgi:Rps23 Pro-64 3,4-dihydroxylase Tpa1-like proline 4-hydroxylase
MQPQLQTSSADPFTYFVLSDFYETAFAERLSHWLSTEAAWQRSVHHFYDQFEFSFRDSPAIPETIAASLLSPAALGNVKQMAENLFGAPFRPNIFVGAHKLVDGQGIGIHTDNAPGGESHRIVVQLSRDWQDDFGGNLVFFGSDHVEDVTNVFRHVFNTAIGFSLGSVSYHAVTNVSHDQRLTLIYGFWSTTSEFNESTEARRTFAIE